MCACACVHACTCTHTLSLFQLLSSSFAAESKWRKRLRFSGKRGFWITGPLSPGLDGFFLEGTGEARWAVYHFIWENSATSNASDRIPSISDSPGPRAEGATEREVIRTGSAVRPAGAGTSQLCVLLQCSPSDLFPWP